MSNASHSELILNVIHYAMRCHAKGDTQALAAMGFDPESMRKLASYSATEHHMLANMRGHFMEINVHDGRMQTAMKLLDLRIEDAAHQDELLLAGAPKALMNALYGLQEDDLAQRRKLLGVADISHGRPKTLDEAQAKIVWETWRATEGQRDVQRWLAIARVGIPLNSAYAAVCEWQKEEEQKTALPQGD